MKFFSLLIFCFISLEVFAQTDYIEIYCNKLHGDDDIGWCNCFVDETRKLLDNKNIETFYTISTLIDSVIRGEKRIDEATNIIVALKVENQNKQNSLIQESFVIEGLVKKKWEELSVEGLGIYRANQIEQIRVNFKADSYDKRIAYIYYNNKTENKLLDTKEISLKNSKSALPVIFTKKLTSKHTYELEILIDGFSSKHYFKVR